MKTGTSEAVKKEGIASLFAFSFVPWFLHVVGQRFIGMWLPAFSVPDAKAVYKHIDGSGGAALGLIFLMVYIWALPSIKYLKAPSPELKDKTRRLANRVHRDAALLVLAIWVFQMVFLRVTYGSLPLAVIPAFILSLAVQFCLLPTFIDWVRARNTGIMELIFEKEELYALRRSFSVPLSLKITLLIVACAFLPFALSAAALNFGAPASVWADAYNHLLAICAIMLIVGLGVVFYGVQRPLDGLIKRMKDLAKGDFSKTRIYFSDEVAYLKAGYNEMVDGLKEREELQDTFGKYMSIEIARELIHNKKVNLGGEDIEAAVMFCDIRNFTPLSEKMGASQLVEFLNNYFHYITPPIDQHNGVINKFIGDAVMAIFTPPLGSSDYAADAVRAALAMRRALAEFNASGKAPSNVEFGIGIHSGKLVAGNIGTSQRLEYTFIGDTVNVASRLESKTKDFGADIILSEAAMEKSKGSVGTAAAFQPLGKVSLKGKAEPMELYKVA